jgi:ubiquinol-cytochrome c reductase cytochrome c1 subunit
MHKIVPFAVVPFAVTLFAAALFLVTGPAFASGDAGLRLDSTPAQRPDNASLQRGARGFVDYCLGCHGAKYFRYERLIDIGFTEDVIKSELMFGTDKIGSTVTTAMSPADAKRWFGVAPPDLSVEARVRGVDWLYNYFIAFYRDDASATGWNNLVFPNVGMPHALHTLTGESRLAAKTFDTHDAATSAVGKGLAKVESLPDGKWRVSTVESDPAAPGTLTPEEYRAFAADLAHFLDYVAEPNKSRRISLGIVVLSYLAVLFVLVYALKRRYWKDVH